MAERRKVAKKLEQDIITIRCPCCNELIPVRINIAGHGVDEGYVEIGGCNETGRKAPFPDVEIGIDIDLMGLKFEGGLDEILDNMSATEKKMHRESYEFDKAHGVYGEQAKKEAEDAENVAKRELEANRSD